MSIRERMKQFIYYLFPVYTRQCIIGIGVIGLLLLVSAFFHEQGESVTGINRPKFNDKTQHVTVYADIGESERIPVQMEVEPVKPTDEEMQRYLEDVNKQWRERVIQYYTSFPNIKGPLRTYENLNKEQTDIQVEGYWEAGQWIDDEGWIDIQGWTEGTKEFIYNSTWTYKGHQLMDRQVVTIDYKQITEGYKRAWYQRDIRTEWMQQKEQKELETRLELPKQDKIHYYTSNDTGWGKKSIGVLLLVGLFVIVLSRNEKKEKQALYEKEMQCHFMYLSQDMVMLYQSGATVYTALYLSLKQRQPLLRGGTRSKEGIDKLCDMMTQEQPIRDVMETFKGIFNFREGKSFSRLLIQGNYYGDHQLSEQLSRISENMWEERIRRARKESEKASSKLMFPMLIIFVVIIMLTVIPTFLEVGQM